MRMKALLVVIASLVPSVALAEDDWKKEQEAERRKQELEDLAARLPKVAPEPGRDKAPERAPPWCDGLKDIDDGFYNPSAIARTIEEAAERNWRAYFEAARMTCKYPKERAIHKAVAVIEQQWINMTGLSEPEALETIKAHLAEEKFEADRKKLCQALTVSDEIEGEEKAFMKARAALFCGDSPMWVSGAHVPGDLITFLDASAGEIDEIVRLAVVTDRSRFALYDEDIGDGDLLGYVYDQIDYQALSRDRLLAMLETAPYKGNSYARATALESLGRAQKALAVVDELVKKKTNDPDWKELLVTAPQRGVAAWKKAEAQWKDQIARSHEFERAFWGPSRKAVAGCWPKLKADFLTVAKTLPHKNAVEAQEALSDPVASLLFTRLAACASVDPAVDKNYAKRLLAIEAEVRYSRGPRLAAFNVALEALTKIVEDRTKFPVQPRDMWALDDRSLHEAAFDAAASAKVDDPMGYVLADNEGVVKSVKKVAGGLQVTFVTDKQKVMGQSCVETNKILTWRADGSPIYYRNCRDTGMITIDVTPDPVTVPADLAGGIKAGALVQFDAARGQAPGRLALPTAVYADKSRKKLIAFYGFEL